MPGSRTQVDEMVQLLIHADQPLVCLPVLSECTPPQLSPHRRPQPETGVSATEAGREQSLVVRGAEKHVIITESASCSDKMPQKNQRRSGFFWLTVSEDLVHHCLVPSHG